MCVQTFAKQDNSDLFLEEKKLQIAKMRAAERAAEKARLMAVPGLLYTAPAHRNQLLRKDRMDAKVDS